MLQYSRMVKVPNTTLRREIKLNTEVKDIKGKEVKGSPSVLSEYQYNFLCGVIQWKDREKDAISPKEIAEAMLVINPSLTINQAWNHYTNTLLVKYKDILTIKVKAHTTTTCRTGNNSCPVIQMAHAGL